MSETNLLFGKRVKATGWAHGVHLQRHEVMVGSRDDHRLYGVSDGGILLWHKGRALIASMDHLDLEPI